jgi:hypothetical protein
MFGLKRDEITEEWRKLHKDELIYMYTSPNIVRIIKTGRMEWAGHVAHMGGGETYTGFWRENPREIDHLGYTSLDGRIILRWIIRKWHTRVWTGSSWLRIGTGDGHL